MMTKRPDGVIVSTLTMDGLIVNEEDGDLVECKGCRERGRFSVHASVEALTLKCGACGWIRVYRFPESPPA